MTIGFVKASHEGLDVVTIVVIEGKFDVDNGIALEMLIDSSEVSLMRGNVWVRDRNVGNR